MRTTCDNIFFYKISGVMLPSALLATFQGKKVYYFRISRFVLRALKCFKWLDDQVTPLHFCDIPCSEKRYLDSKWNIGCFLTDLEDHNFKLFLKGKNERKYKLALRRLESEKAHYEAMFCALLEWHRPEYFQMNWYCKSRIYIESSKLSCLKRHELIESIDLLWEALQIVFEKIVHFLRSRVESWEKLRVPKKEIDSVGPFPERQIDKFKVGYIPHRGVFYGDFFIKDYYYSSVYDSFKRERILHISIKDPISPISDLKTYEYYTNHDIAFCDIWDWKRIKLFKILTRFFSEILIDCNLKGFKLLFSPRFLLFLLRIQVYKEMFRACSNLELIIFGYDATINPLVALPKVRNSCKSPDIYKVQTELMITFY